MPIFYQKTFSQKHDDPMSFFFSKIRDLLSCPYFVKKPLFSKKTRRYHVFSLEFFIKNRNTVMPKSGQKNVNSVKTILSYGPKKSKWCPFFPILNEKATLFMPIFCWKNVHWDLFLFQKSSKKRPLQFFRRPQQITRFSFGRGKMLYTIGTFLITSGRVLM